MDTRVCVVGVDLNTQVLSGVDNLNEQGKDAAGEVPEQLRLLRPKLSQGFPAEFGVFHGAVSAGMAADGPALTGVAAGNGVAEYGGKAIAAPELFLEDGRKTQDCFHFSVSFSASMASFTAPMTP